MIQFTIPGQPVAKGRPKFTVRGGFASAYTPAKTKAYETLVAGIATRAMAGRPPSDRAIEVLLELRMQIPVSWSKKKQVAASAGKVRATKKPDIDNVVKSILDASNGIVWIDDAQVVVLTVRKLYHADPCVMIGVRAVEGETA
ncbi:MAG: RusA family crossover junction endodeoxyribonuclease [Pseudomonadota bacterium]